MQNTERKFFIRFAVTSDTRGAGCYEPAYFIDRPGHKQDGELLTYAEMVEQARALIDQGWHFAIEQ